MRRKCIRPSTNDDEGITDLSIEKNGVMQAKTYIFCVDYKSRSRTAALGEHSMRECAWT